MEPLLLIENLNIDIRIKNTYYPAVESLSLEVHPEEIVGIVGESGSGKSLTAKAILQILPPNARIQADKMLYKGIDLAKASHHQMHKLRGKEISMIFQDPLSSLNPLQKVGKQVEEVLEIHTDWDAQKRRQAVYSMFEQVSFDDPERVYRLYPHELSGGMRQRIVICMALICQPDLIIADEPTTALDNTIQRQILEITKSLVRNMNKSLILISHDWGVISWMCDRVYVMYAGQVVETGLTDQVVTRPQHPYTKGLLAAIPSLKKRGQKLYNIPFKVAAIDTRVKGNWPYIEAGSSYSDQDIYAMFPELERRVGNES